VVVAGKVVKAAKDAAAITVDPPLGGQRVLAVGRSSLTLKAFLEQAAPRIMREPAVVLISQSAEHVNVVDAAMLTQLGLDLKALRLLPDYVVMDLAEDRDELWFVEVVETDGPIHDGRRASLLDWAVTSGMDPEQCRFLTAFPPEPLGRPQAFPCWPGTRSHGSPTS
jgi:hypothetical protein